MAGWPAAEAQQDSVRYIATTTEPSVCDSNLLLKKQKRWRLPVVLATEGVLYTGSVVGLNYLWYEDYPRSPFHFINDNAEWMGMDKFGHATTSYTLGALGYDVLRWSGVKRKTAIWAGGSLGLIFLTSIEVLDGFSAEWGASWGDMIANTGGTALFISQQLVWNEQRFKLKYSFWPSDYARYRPDLLGDGFTQQLLKDYNGQTYWLSCNVWSFLPHRNNTMFPRWLNIAVGYGADGMLGGDKNPVEFASIQRYHQFYLSLDVDLTKIRTRSKALKTIFNLIGFIKFPSPTIEFNTNSTDNVKFHWIFF